jgi:hypothetical protein
MVSAIDKKIFIKRLSNHFSANACVGAFHSATGAIESALKYVSPDAHWIARRIATTGGGGAEITGSEDRAVGDLLSVEPCAA